MKIGILYGLSKIETQLGNDLFVVVVAYCLFNVGFELVAALECLVSCKNVWALIQIAPGIWPTL
jgi:hypothetical protein